jgi:ornithine decarboxylase
MAPSAITVIEHNASFSSLESILDKNTTHVEHNGVNTPKGLIGSALQKKVESIDHESCEPGEEDSFFVADLGEVYRQHMRWKKNLPRVKPFYGEHEIHQ